MKKLTVFFIVLMAMAILFSGCEKKPTSSDPNDDNANLDPANFDYYAYIINTTNNGKDYSYAVYILSEKSDITSAEFYVEGEQVQLAYQPYLGGWIGTDMALQPDHTYSFQIKINESKYSKTFSLKLPVAPVVNWPETIDLNTDTNVSWTMPSNAMYQEFEGDAYKMEAESSVNNFKILSPSDRNFTIKKNWLPVDYDEYNFSVVEMNYYKDSSHLLISSGELSQVEYGYTKKMTIEEKLEKIKKAVKNLK